MHVANQGLFNYSGFYTLLETRLSSDNSWNKKLYSYELSCYFVFIGLLPEGKKVGIPLLGILLHIQANFCDNSLQAPQ